MKKAKRAIAMKERKTNKKQTSKFSNEHTCLTNAALETTPAAYPLSPLQEGLLFHALNSPDSSAHFEQMIGTFDAKMDDQAYEQAWHMAIKRYDVLRTSFTWQGLARPLQTVHEEVDLTVERIDLAEYSGRDEQEKLDNLIYHDRARGFDFQKAPLMRVLSGTD